MHTKTSYWLWYPGDFELYHALKQNFSRVERGCSWPAFWKSEGYRNRVVFRRSYDLPEESTFFVTGVTGSVGYVQLDEEKHPFDTLIFCTPGKHRISIHIGCLGCIPSVYVSGDRVCSDDGWQVEDYSMPPVPAAHNRYYTDASRDPSEWPYAEKVYEPVAVEEINQGVLYTFETELTASLEVIGPGSPLVYLGESRSEALDTKNCYYFCRPDEATRRCPRQAVRYVFLPDVHKSDYFVRAIHQYTDIPQRSSFTSDDDELNRIFQVAAHTFSLCSGCFFLDGIKRDKWIWGGDAYQSMFVNRYLTADAEIEKRTLLALRGNDPVNTHVNTILDYSLLWIISLGVFYESYGDEDFIRQIYPKARSLMDLSLSQRDENGFLVGRKQDWVFVDWADFDRDGPLCAEQMLFAASCRTMAMYAPESEKQTYLSLYAELLEKIDRFFWDKEKQAYVDSYRSGNRHITRHANIFAIVFDLVEESRKQLLAESVLFNQSIPAIKTPYFRFYELEALCRLGYLKEVLAEIKSYWGGMLRLGAVTFWEEYDPARPIEQQYEMYGDPFGKSLCHAWSASPIYLLARYFAGLRPIKPGGTEFEATPQTQFFRELDCTFPMGQKQVHITLHNGQVSVESYPYINSSLTDKEDHHE